MPPADLLRWLDGRKLDAVIHLGAISDTTATDGDLVMENNFRLLAAAARLVHGDAHAVHLCLLGRDLRRRRRRASPTTGRPRALQRLKPMNLYGWSKHLFDLAVVERVARKEKLPPQWAGLKFFNVFGPNEYHKGEMMSLVAKRFDDAKAGEPIRLFKSHRDGIGDGEQRRDFIYVDDAVAVVRWLMETPSVIGHLQCRHRQGAQLPRSDHRDVRGARPQARRSNMSTCRTSIRDSYQYFTAGRDRPICGARATTPASRRSKTAVQRYVTQLSRSRRPLSLIDAMFDFEEALSEHRRQQTMLCVGDLMLDDFVYGEVARISPEAPAPVIAVKRNEVEIGGAGNVARNIAALGARCIFVGLVGDDEAGLTLTQRARQARCGDRAPISWSTARGRRRARCASSPSIIRPICCAPIGKTAEPASAESRGGCHRPCASGAAAGRRGGALRLCQGRADAAGHPRRHRRRRAGSASR